MISICIDCNAAVLKFGLDWVRNAEDQENGGVKALVKKAADGGLGVKTFWECDHVCWAPLPAQQ